MSATIIESHITYTAETFKRVSLQRETLVHTEFEECRFVGCDFSEAVFQRCRFIDCSFVECTMRLVELRESVIAGATFTQCNLMGINWALANWKDFAALLARFSFTNCDLSYCSFFKLNLKKMKMVGCKAEEVNFVEADLQQAIFDGTDLTGALFLNSDLRDADFTGASHYHIKVTENRLDRAKFSLPEAINLLYAMNIKLDGMDQNGSGR